MVSGVMEELTDGNVESQYAAEGTPWRQASCNKEIGCDEKVE